MPSGPGQGNICTHIVSQPLTASVQAAAIRFFFLCFVLFGERGEGGMSNSREKVWQYTGRDQQNTNLFSVHRLGQIIGGNSFQRHRTSMPRPSWMTRWRRRRPPCPSWPQTGWPDGPGHTNPNDANSITGLYVKRVQGTEDGCAAAHQGASIFRRDGVGDPEQGGNVPRDGGAEATLVV